MKKDDWLRVIAIYVLLYLLTRLITYISVMNGILYGDIILMVVILFLMCCYSVTSGEGISISLEQKLEKRIIAKRDNEIARNTLIAINEEKLNLIRGQYLLNKSIQDIANDLGMSMITVKKYIDEIEKELKK